MQKFVDRAGRIWIVDIDNTTLRRVKTLTGVHLLEAIDGDLITRLSTDPLLLGDVLFAICKPQADQQQITDEAFGEGLAGNSIDDATGALLEALINYFPESRRRLLRKAAEKQKLIETVIWRVNWTGDWQLKIPHPDGGGGACSQWKPLTNEATLWSEHVQSTIDGKSTFNKAITCVGLVDSAHIQIIVD